MKNKPPIVCCAYANDARYRLELEQEFKAISHALTDARDNLQLSLEPLPQSSLDEIYRTFNHYHNRIAIFHYSGHSNATFLKLDGTYARADHLSVLIGMQQNLKLVFLNGCSNKAQVAALAKQGVKAIIATASPIEDTASVSFATAFYDALGHGKNIQQAFDTAKSKLHQEQPNIEIVQRGLKVLKNEAELPWGLYADDAADLEWQLPSPQAMPASTMDYQAIVPLHDEDCNKALVREIFQGLGALDEACETLWQSYLAEDEDPNMLPELQGKIYDAFPSVLSIQIRDLFTPEAETEGRRRLEEIRHVYTLLSKLLCAITLADLWRVLLLKDEETGALIPDAALQIQAQYRADIMQYCQLTAETAEQFDYIWLARSIYHFFEENDLQFIFPEMTKALQNLQAAEAQTAYHFLEFHLKQPLLSSAIPSSEVVQLCKVAEFHLGVLLKHCIFLTQYQLVSVNDIQVYKSLLHSKANFMHAKAVLHGNDSTRWRITQQQRASYTCNRAVVLTKDISSEDSPLTLAPFIIDENVLKKRSAATPKIHFWAGRTAENELHYQLAEDMNNAFFLPPKLRPENYRNKELEAVRMLWDSFCEHIKNLKTHE